jgi:hypothetical protein
MAVLEWLMEWLMSWQEQMLARMIPRGGARRDPIPRCGEKSSPGFELPVDRAPAARIPSRIC